MSWGYGGHPPASIFFCGGGGGGTRGLFSRLHLHHLNSPPSALWLRSALQLLTTTTTCNLMQKPEVGANPKPGECPQTYVKCDRPLRPSGAIKYHMCAIWLHNGCVLQSNRGRCACCPSNLFILVCSYVSTTKGLQMTEICGHMIRITPSCSYAYHCSLT